MPLLHSLRQGQLTESNSWKEKRWDALTGHPSANTKIVYPVIGLAGGLFDNLQFTQLFLGYHAVLPATCFVVFLQHEIQFTDLSF
jgi:hypothetical protein